MSRVVDTLLSHFFKHLIGHPHRSLPSRPFRCHRYPTAFLSIFPSAPVAKVRPQRELPKFSDFYSTSTISSSLSSPSSSESFASPYLSVRIFCPNHLVDSLSEALFCFGATSTSVDEQEGNQDNNEIIVCAFSVSHNVDECISYAANSIGLKEVPSYEVEMHDHTDWITRTQDSFHPVEVLKGVWVVPEWRDTPDPLATNIILNPGLAFGTGEHPTTKLCLSLLRHSIKGGESFFDYGTGSGILAIAALKFGAELSVGIDIEPHAITSAQHNASLNKIEPERLHLCLVHDGIVVDDAPNNDIRQKSPSQVEGIAGTGNGKFDVVIANILLNPLLDLAVQIVSYAKPGAVVGVSGVISEQVPYVLERYSQLLEGLTVSEIDDWACISGTKKLDASQF